MDKRAWRVLINGILVITLIVLSACSAAATPTSKPSDQNPGSAPPNADATKPVAAATAASAPAGAKPAGSDVKPLDPPVSMKVGAAPQMSNAGLFIAYEKGYFQQEGLKVELVNFASDTEKMPPLISGELDAGITLFQAALFNALGRAVGMKVVSGAQRYTPGHGGTILMVRKDLAGQIKDFKDLKGKKIGRAGTGNAADIVVQRAVAKGGLTDKEVEIITLAAPDQNVALANKSIDLALQTEPQATLGARQGLSVKWKPSDEVYPNLELSSWIYSEKFQKEKPEAAKRFMVALLRGVREFIDVFQKGKGDRKAMVNILVKYTGINDQSLFDEMNLPDFHPDGVIDKKLVADDLQYYTEKNLVQAKVDLNSLFDSQYVDYAVSRLGKFQ